MALDGEQHLQEQVSEKVLAENVLIAPGSVKPDATFWSALIQDRGCNVMTLLKRRLRPGRARSNSDGQGRSGSCLLLMMTESLSMALTQTEKNGTRLI